MRVALGIDIGTTTVCGVAVDADTGELRQRNTLPNDTFLDRPKAKEKRQDPEAIYQKALSLVDKYRREFSEIAAIGVTGQMHGVLYLDAAGKSVSPLYTWQDLRADETDGKQTYADEFSAAVGKQTPAGYGLVTHFTLLKNGQAPKEAVSFATIGDYIAMRLCRVAGVQMHISNAASLGGFSVNEGHFAEKALKQLGIKPDFLPVVTQKNAEIGRYHGIPVAVALGDNQASFLGSVREENTLLINIGTGSQVSLLSDGQKESPDCEIRPLYEDHCLSVGACLCGGRAYRSLCRFFEEVGARLFDAKNPDLYAAMEKLADRQSSLLVDPRFSGTRKNPDIRGSITQIGEENFTPGQLITATLTGMAEELYHLYEQMRPEKHPVVRAVGSGNGIRKNALLRRILEERFGLPLQMPVHREEAAFGAALFALCAAGVYRDLPSAQKALIRYIGEETPAG